MKWIRWWIKEAQLRLFIRAPKPGTAEAKALGCECDTFHNEEKALGSFVLSYCQLHRGKLLRALMYLNAPMFDGVYAISINEGGWPINFTAVADSGRRSIRLYFFGFTWFKCVRLGP